MNEVQINNFITNYGKYFSDETMISIRSHLEEYPEEMYPQVMSITGLKSPTTALILAFFSLDRIYLKDYLMGILKILLYFLFIWVIVDLFSVKKRTYELNEKIFFEAIGGAGYAGITCNSPVLDPDDSSLNNATQGLKNAAGNAVRIINDPRTKQSLKEVKKAFKGFRNSL